MKNSISVLIVVLILGNCLFAQVAHTTINCNCHGQSQLKEFIDDRNIPELFFADSNTGTYENWSTSILCPGGKPAAPVSEEDSNLVELNYAEWSCKYSAFMAMDNDPKTCWCEGAKGDGIGEILLVSVNTHKDIFIWSGFGKSEKLFKANNRPRKIRLYFFYTIEPAEAVQEGIGFKDIRLHKTEEVELDDKNGYQPLPYLMESFDEETVTATFLAVEILTVYKGTLFEDTCISEISNHVR